MQKVHLASDPGASWSGDLPVPCSEPIGETMESEPKSQLMSRLFSIPVGQRDKVLLWKDEQKAAVAEMLDKLLNLPRKYCHPDCVVSDDRCLVVQGDCDPARGVFWHLFSVAVADASTITPEILHDPTMSIPLCMHVCIFDEAELKWHVFEGETFRHIHGAVRKCGKYINTCLAP